jgi:hypothetical protein
MKIRDQPEAGDDALGKTAHLDDSYRVRIAGGGENGRDARPGVPLRDQWQQAECALDSARAEFKAAAAAVIDRLKAGEDLPKPELDREWNARLRLLEARELFKRLGHLRKAFGDG